MNVYQVKAKRYRTEIETLLVTVQAPCLSTAEGTAAQMIEHGVFTLIDTETDCEDLCIHRIDFVCKVGQQTADQT